MRKAVKYILVFLLGMLTYFIVLAIYYVFFG